MAFPFSLCSSVVHDQLHQFLFKFTELSRFVPILSELMIFSIFMFFFVKFGDNWLDNFQRSTKNIEFLKEFEHKIKTTIKKEIFCNFIVMHLTNDYKGWKKNNLKKN